MKRLFRKLSQYLPRSFQRLAHRLRNFRKQTVDSFSEKANDSVPFFDSDLFHFLEQDIY